MVFEQCREILLKESELVQRIAGLQNLINNAVINRDWTDFEGHFSELGGLGGEFAALESQREQIFAEDREMPAGTFYAFAAKFPPQQRNELTGLYRKLKLDIVGVRMAGETLMAYIAGARATMAGFFEIVFPDRKGNIYTPHGRPMSHDMRSMVLNQSF